MSIYFSTITCRLFKAKALFQCCHFSARATFLCSVAVSHLCLHHYFLEGDRELANSIRCPSIMCVLCQRVVPSITTVLHVLRLPAATALLVNVIPLYILNFHRYLVDGTQSWKDFILNLTAFKGMYCWNPLSALPQNQCFIKGYIFFHSVEAAKFVVEVFQNHIGSK